MLGFNNSVGLHEPKLDLLDFQIFVNLATKAATIIITNVLLIILLKLFAILSIIDQSGFERGADVIVRILQGINRGLLYCVFLWRFHKFAKDNLV